MACQVRRRDDLPTYKGEKAWECAECGAVMFSPRKPVCRRVAASEMEARRVAAEVEAIELDLDSKEQK